MKQLNVLHVFKSYYPETVGGVEQVIRQLARAGQQHGIQADVFTLSDQAAHSYDFEGQRVFAAHRDLELASTGFSLSAFKQFKRLLADYDILHYHYPWPFGDLMHLALGRNKPSVVTYHSDIVKQKSLERLYRPIQQRFLRAMDRIVVTSPNYLASSTTLKPFYSKTRVVPIGLDKNSYPKVSPERLDALKQQHGEDFFLFIGVLRYYKGLHTLLEALKGTSINVLIAGSGPLEAELKQQAKDSQLSNVKFLGQVSEEDKAALLSLCRALVFPSHLRSEAFGISLLEGAMFGKPMISCEIGSGTTYINRADVTGLVIPPETPQALRQAMQQLQADDGRCERMGKQALLRYNELFTDTKMLEGYQQIYQELAATSR